LRKRMEHRLGFAWFVGTGISDPFDCFSPKRDAGRFGAKEWTSGERGNKGNVVTNLSPM
jgi:hypothetical protein